MVTRITQLELQQLEQNPEISLRRIWNATSSPIPKVYKKTSVQVETASTFFIEQVAY